MNEYLMFGVVLHKQQMFLNYSRFIVFGQMVCRYGGKVYIPSEIGYLLYVNILGLNPFDTDLLLLKKIN